MLLLCMVTSLLLTPFSFVKLFKKMNKELYLYQKILSRHQVNHFKVHNPTHPSPPPKPHNFTSKEVDRPPYTTTTPCC